MRPDSTIQDVVNRSAMDAKRTSYFKWRLARRAHGSNLAHLIFGKFGAAICAARFASAFRITQVGLGNMRPVFASDDVTDSTAHNAIFVGEFVLRDTAIGIAVSNFENLISRELATTNLFAAGNTFGAQLGMVFTTATHVVSSFGNTIPNVVGGSSCKQMRRIAAFGIVARMADQMIQRVSAMSEEVRNAVSFQGAFLGFELPIAACELSAKPFPAITGLTNADFRPEAGNVKGVKLGEWFRCGHVILHVWRKVSQMYCNTLYTVGDKSASQHRPCTTGGF